MDVESGSSTDKSFGYRQSTGRLWIIRAIWQAWSVSHGNNIDRLVHQAGIVTWWTGSIYVHSMYTCTRLGLQRWNSQTIKEGSSVAAPHLTDTSGAPNGFRIVALTSGPGKAERHRRYECEVYRYLVLILDVLSGPLIWVVDNEQFAQGVEEQAWVGVQWPVESFLTLTWPGVVSRKLAIIIVVRRIEVVIRQSGLTYSRRLLTWDRMMIGVAGGLS